MDEARKQLIGETEILVIEDEEVVRQALTRFLRSKGYSCTSVADAGQAREALGKRSFGLVLCDIQLPDGSGLDLLQQIADELPNTATVMVTGLDDPAIAEQAIEMGAYGYVVKPFRPNEILINVMNALRRRELEKRQRAHGQEIESKLTVRTQSLTTAVRRLADAEAEGRGAWKEMLDRLGKALSLRDEETGRHIERVSLCCGLLAEKHGDMPVASESLGQASMLHDAGKIGVPDAILLKRGALTDDERRIVQKHCELGYQLLSGSHSHLLDIAAMVALTHHEQWDGNGYPQGLSGPTIPIEGRITAVADVFDALTSDRVYRLAFSIDQAVEMMRAGRERQFDPDLVDLFLGSLDEFLAIKTEHPDPDYEDAQPIGVVIIDGHRIFAHGLATLLRSTQDLVVLGTGSSVEQAISLCRETSPDVALVNWSLPDGDGSEAARCLKEVRPETRVVILTPSLDGAIVAAALAAGCSGILSKEGELEDVADAVRAAYLGEVNISLARLAVAAERIREPLPPRVDLTNRELEVLGLLAEGLSNDAIAERLFLSLNTVRNHVQRIIAKLGSHSKLEAVTTALRSGLISFPRYTGPGPSRA